MTQTSKTFSYLTVFVFALVALIAFGFFNKAQSQAEAVATRGPYMLASGDRQTVWRIDQASGRVSYCMRDTQSMDPKYIETRPPFCSAWSNN